MTTVRLSINEARDATRRVLAAVEHLAAIRLIEMHCKALKPISVEAGDFTMVTQLGVRAEPDGDTLATYSQYRVAAIDDDAEEPTADNTVWTVDLTFVVHWTLITDVTALDAQCFAMSQGALTCHPYAREAIQNATARMGYPPATIDLIFDPWSAGDGGIIELHLPAAGAHDRDTEA